MRIEQRLAKLETVLTPPTRHVVRVDWSAHCANPDAAVHGREVRRVVVNPKPLAIRTEHAHDTEPPPPRDTA